MGSLTNVWLPKKKDGTCPKEFLLAQKRAKVAISEGEKKKVQLTIF
jgi:hypothetical protein